MSKLVLPPFCKGVRFFPFSVSPFSEVVCRKANKTGSHNIVSDIKVKYNIASVNTDWLQSPVTKYFSHNPV